MIRIVFIVALFLTSFSGKVVAQDFPLNLNENMLFEVSVRDSVRFTYLYIIDSVDLWFKKDHSDIDLVIKKKRPEGKGYKWTGSGTMQKLKGKRHEDAVVVFDFTVEFYASKAKFTFRDFRHVNKTTSKLSGGSLDALKPPFKKVMKKNEWNELKANCRGRVEALVLDIRQNAGSPN